MKTKISIHDFRFEFMGRGHYRVTDYTRNHTMCEIRELVIE